MWPRSAMRPGMRDVVLAAPAELTQASCWLGADGASSAVRPDKFWSPGSGGAYSAPPGRRKLSLLLLQELEDHLGLAVGLGEHRRACLRQNLLLRQSRHLRRHVDVLDLAVGRRQVLLGRVDRIRRVLQPVLNRTQRPGLSRDR